MRLNGISERKKDQPKVDHLDGQLSARTRRSQASAFDPSRRSRLSTALVCALAQLCHRLMLEQEERRRSAWWGTRCELTSWS